MKLFVVTGEASGDLHAAEVVRTLRHIDPNLQVNGMGGELLRAEGVIIEHGIDQMGVVGLFNVLVQLPMFRRVFEALLRRINEIQPDALLLVDYPDFNLRLARRCRRLGIPIIYYISPQVWAWRRRRVQQIARDVDHMIVIFPFEETLYEKYSLPVTYVGHPLVEQLEPFRREREGRPDTPLKLALMPGSRRSEVSSLLKAMVGASAELARSRPVDAYVIKAPTIQRQLIDRELGALSTSIRVVERHGREALADADLAFCSSGTATLESGILGVPAVVMYRLSRLTLAVARRLVDIPHFSLVNIVAEKCVIPELLQEDVTPRRIAAEALSLLDPERYRKTVEELDAVRAKLGTPGASKRAAEKIYKLMRAAAASSAS